MRADRFELPLRVVIDDPVPGVAIVQQRGATGKAELVPAAQTSTSELAFEFEVTVEGALPDGRPRLLGPWVQGPPGARFTYLCVGQAAGQRGSEWSRRVKVPLFGLAWEAIQALKPGQRLEAHIASRGKDGTPACASVKLLGDGWRGAG